MSASRQVDVLRRVHSNGRLVLDGVVPLERDPSYALRQLVKQLSLRDVRYDAHVVMSHAPQE